MARTMVDVRVWHNTLEIRQQLVTEVCCDCAVVFAMPKNLYNRAQEDPTVHFYCPNGHSQHYTKDALAAARRERDAARRRAESAEAAVRAERANRKTAERQAAAFKGQATRIRKRIGNGTCPACHRHFTNVERHMGTQHPGYADALVTPSE
jgi:hypothetical protein